MTIKNLNTTVLLGVIVACISVVRSGGCPAGTYYSGGECLVCPMGGYQPLSNMDHCLKCPRGSYADNRGSAQCTACPENHITYFDESTSFYDCVGPRLKVSEFDDKISEVLYYSDVSFDDYSHGRVTVLSGTWFIFKKTGQILELDDGKSIEFGKVFNDEVRSASPKINNEYCYTEEGKEYTGKAHQTEYGTTCLNWKDIPSVTGVGDHNYCRSHGAYSKRPYCFVDGDLDPRAVPCTVPKCVWDVKCKSVANGAGYVGDVSETAGGIECQNWSSDSPHPHGYNDVGDHNKCRNPGGEGEGAWCFTTYLFKRWDYCTVRQCDKTKDSRYDYV